MPTTNMNLPIPTVSQTGGPDWATDNNSCFTIIDAHDHTTGNGVQITPSGLNINANLTFNSSYAATNLKYSGYTAQSSPLSGSLTNIVYASGVDLYFNDGSGNQVRITSGGGVAGSPGSIGSLSSPAAATYSAGSTKFIWTADTNKYAAMDNGAVTIRETNVASANGITLASPSALASGYTLTFPAALPGSTQYVASSSGGTLSFVSADTIGSAMTSTGANAIGSTMTSTGANAVAASRTRATGTTVAAGGIALSTGTGSTSDMSPGAVFTDVTNLTVTITTSGRPVFLAIQPDSSGGGVQSSYITPAASGTAGSYAEFMFVRDGVGISYPTRKSAGYGTSVNNTTPSGSGWIQFVDSPAAGTYTYKLQAKYISFGGTAPSSEILVRYVRLVAYEL